MTIAVDLVHYLSGFSTLSGVPIRAQTVELNADNEALSFDVLDDIPDRVYGESGVGHDFSVSLRFVAADYGRIDEVRQQVVSSFAGTSFTMGENGDSVVRMSQVTFTTGQKVEIGERLLSVIINVQMKINT